MMCLPRDLLGFCVGVNIYLQIASGRLRAQQSNTVQMVSLITDKVKEVHKGKN